MKLLLDGYPVPREEFTGAKTTSIDITTMTDDEQREIAVSQEFTLKGHAFEIVEQQVINNPEGKNASIPVKIYEDTCCETDILLFEGILRGDMVDWCYDDCECTVQFIEQTATTEQINCIKSTLIFDNWNGFQQAAHPRVTYCIEIRPDFLQIIILDMAIVLNFILLILTPIVAIVSAIYSVITAIVDALNAIIPGDGPINWDGGGFDGSDETSILEEYVAFMNDITERVVGCGRKHPSPLLRNYIQNVCDKCGLTFQSSILNDLTSDYYNTVYLSAPVQKGTLFNSNTYIDENKPILTLEGLLDSLKPVFNARWEVLNNILYFERKDWFWNGDPFVNYESLLSANMIVERLCLAWRDEERPSYIQAGYTPDPIDTVGNEAMERFNEIVEWNQPYSALQSGYKEVALSFGTPRFRNDGIEEDILGNFEQAPFIGPIIQQFQNVLILEKGVAFQPKLLIWDGVDINNAKIRRYNIPGSGVSTGQNANYPYQFNEVNVEPNTAYSSTQPGMALYGRFYAWENPKLIADQGKEFTFSFNYNCESLEASLTAQFVQLPIGIGRITKLTVNLDDKTIQITGNV